MPWESEVTAWRWAKHCIDWYTRAGKGSGAGGVVGTRGLQSRHSHAGHCAAGAHSCYQPAAAPRSLSLTHPPYLPTCCHTWLSLNLSPLIIILFLPMPSTRDKMLYHMR